MDDIKEIELNGVTITVKNFPSLSTENIIGWKGVKDENGNEIPFSRENLLSLFEGTFEVSDIAMIPGETPDVAADGKE